MLKQKNFIILILGLALGILISTGTAVLAEREVESAGLGIEVTMENSYLKVVSPTDDTPAQRTGMEAGDLVVRLDEKPVKGIPPAESPAIPTPGVVCRGEDVCAKLYVQEALPKFEEGLNRNQELVTFGIPLSPEDNVTDPNQLSVQGADSQLRILRSYKSGAASWIAVDALVSVEARGIAELELVPTVAARSIVPLASLGPNLIHINTQAAQFKVPLHGNALLSSAYMDGIEKLTAPVVPYMETADGTSLVPIITHAGIEENGAIKAVIRLEGELSYPEKDTGWFTARLTFVRDRKDVKAEITFQNDRQAQIKPLAYHALGLKFQANVGANPSVAFGMTDGSVLQGSVGNGAHLYQGMVPNYPLNDPGAFNCWPVKPHIAGTCVEGVFTAATGQSGIDLQINTDQKLTGDSNTQSARGDMLIEGTSTSMAVAQRWMAALSPSALEASSDGSIDISFYSRRSPRSDLALNWGAHDTRQVLIDFGAENEADAAAAAYRIDYPLVGRADFDHYLKSKAFYGTDKWLTIKQQNQYFDAQGDAVPWQAKVEGTGVHILRQKHWRRNYHRTEKSLLDFVRSGNTSYMLSAWQQGQFEMDYAFAHSADFDLGANPNIARNNRGQVPYDNAHQLSGYMPLLYAMTADQRIGDAIPEYGESVLGKYSHYYPQPPITNSYRSNLRALENIAWLWQYTGDERYLNKVKEAVDFYIDSRGQANRATHGRDLERGFFYMDTDMWEDTTYTQYRHKRITFGFIDVQIAGQTFYDVRRILAETGVNYRDQEFEDALVGQAQFIFRELSKPDDIWIGRHHYYLDEYLDEKDIGSSAYFPSHWAILLYDVLGDKTQLQKSYNIIKKKFSKNVGEGDTSRPMMQRQMWYANNQPVPADGWTNIALDVSRLASGYKLEWTVPEGARRYRIKTSDKPIVEWLGFDPVTRTFEYAPADYTAWFAATNLSNVPTPQGAGTHQSLIVNDPSAVKHFSLVYSNNGVPDATDNCPLFSNPDQTDTDDNGKGEACDTNGGVATNTWIRRSDSTGIRVWETGIAYDPATKKIIQHGGHDFGDYVQTNYTRLLDSQTGKWEWSKAPARPQRRCITELAYIDSIKKIITINGRTSHGSLPMGGFNPDQTQVWRKDKLGPWLYDGASDTWETALDDDGNDLLYGLHTRIAYDASSDAVYVIQPDGLIAYFVHQNRTQFIPVPDALYHRIAYAMAVDPITRKLVIFGGTGAGNYNWSDNQASAYKRVARNDTWVLDLETLKWQEIITDVKPDKGMPMLHHLELPMLYHPPSGRLLLIQTPVNHYEPDPSKWPNTELWAFDTRAMKWQLIKMESPLRLPPLLAYDSDRDFLVAVGGDVDANEKEAQRVVGIPHNIFVTGSDALFEARIQIPGGHRVTPRPNVLKAETTAEGVHLSWEYTGKVDVYRAPKGVYNIFPGKFQLVTEDVSGGEYTDRDLGSAYAYMIRSKDGYQWSTTAYITPSAPKGLTAQVNSATSVTLTWSSDNSVKGWHLYRSHGKESPVLVSKTLLTEPRFVDTVNASNVHYHYFVRAVGVNGVVSGHSARAHTAPAAPEKLSVDKISDTKYRVQWRSPETIQLWYSPIHKNTFKWGQADILNWWNSWVLIGEISEGDAEIELPEPPPGEHVYFYARSINVLGNTGFYSDIVSPTDERFLPRINNSEATQSKAPQAKIAMLGDQLKKNDDVLEYSLTTFSGNNIAIIKFPNPSITPEAILLH